MACAATTHGYASRQKTGQQAKEYRRWSDMKTRCTNPKHIHYAEYGGRGIRVCERWMNSFEAFLADMGPPPSPRHTLDRKNNDGDYCPENCRWATRREQTLNSRHARWLEYKGERLPLIDWARRFGVHSAALIYHLKRGRSMEEIVRHFTSSRGLQRH
jgi:hypothetical protein